MHYSQRHRRLCSIFIAREHGIRAPNEKFHSIFVLVHLKYLMELNGDGVNRRKKKREEVDQVRRRVSHSLGHRARLPELSYTSSVLVSRARAPGNKRNADSFVLLMRKRMQRTIRGTARNLFKTAFVRVRETISHSRTRTHTHIFTPHFQCDGRVSLHRMPLATIII